MADEVHHSWLIAGQGFVIAKNGVDLLELRVERLGLVGKERAVLLAYGPVGSDFAEAAAERREARERSAAEAMGGVDQVE